MAQGFYETNPPLSVLVYAPAFLLAQHGIMTLAHSILVYGLLLVGLSVVATYKAITKWDFLSGVDKGVICALLLLGGTIMTNPEFGQRDHLLALGAVPLCCVLLSRTWGFESDRGWTLAILVVGTLLLLLKPYYGLLPAFLMGHRMLTRRNFMAAFDYDFLIMAGVTVTYALGLYVFFNDYLRLILPDLPYLYGATGARFKATVILLCGFSWALLWAVTLHQGRTLRRVGLARIMLTLAGFSFLIFLLMNKGYAYHLVPFQLFMLIAAGLLLRAYTPWLVVALVAGVLAFPKAYYPSPDFIKGQEVTRIVSECGVDCRFLMLGPPVRAIQHVSYYAGKEHASRFSKVWFIEGLLDREKKNSGLKETAILRQKYSDMVAEDMGLYRPQIIFVCKNLTDTFAYLSQSPAFADQIKAYRYERTVSFDTIAFFEKPGLQDFKKMPCDLYKRK